MNWFTTYDKNAGLKRVAEKLSISEDEAANEISKVEGEMVLFQDEEGQKRLKNAEKTSHLEKIGRFYRRQVGSTCCGVASLGKAIRIRFT
jgi:hypothetical protein